MKTLDTILQVCSGIIGGAVLVITGALVSVSLGTLFFG